MSELNAITTLRSRLHSAAWNAADDAECLRLKSAKRQDAAVVLRRKAALADTDCFAAFEERLQAFLLAFVTYPEASRAVIVRYFERLNLRDDVQIPFESLVAKRPNMAALPPDCRVIADAWERMPDEVICLLEAVLRGSGENE